MFSKRVRENVISKVSIDGYAKIFDSSYNNFPDMSMLTTLKILFGNRVDDTKEIRASYTRVSMPYTVQGQSTEQIFASYRTWLSSYLFDELFSSIQSEVDPKRVFIKVIELSGEHTSENIAKINSFVSDIPKVLTEPTSVKALLDYNGQYGCDSTFNFAPVNIDETIASYLEQSMSNQKSWAITFKYYGCKVALILGLSGKAAANFGYLHKLQTVIPRLFPSYFECNPITELELEYLKALTASDLTTYDAVVDKAIIELGIDKLFLKSKLSDFYNGTLASNIRKIERRIEHNYQSIKDRMDEISTCYKYINQDNELLSNYKIKGDQAGEELYDYLDGNKKVTLLDASTNGTVYVKIETPLVNFDQDLARIMINDERSNFYSPLKEIDKSKLKILLTDLLLEEKIKLRLYYCLALQTATVDYSAHVSSGMGYNDYRLTAIANPHLSYFGCYGNNEPKIIEALNQSDVVGAIASAIGSVGNINFGDGYVVPRFMVDFVYSAQKCIELPDGTLTTPLEYMKGL